MKSNVSVLFLLLLLIGSVFIFQSSATLTPLQEDTDTDEDDTDTPEDDDSEDTDQTDNTEDENDEEDDTDEDGIDDDTESAYEREVEMEQSEREFRIESELKNGENKDEFEIEFKIGGGDEPEIEFEYSTEAGDNETELSYRINFDEVIEYQDDGVAGYQEGNDTIVGEVYDLGQADWDPIVYETLTGSSGETIYSAIATTSDGIFSLVLKLSSGFTQVNSTIVTPNAIKIDVIIDGFNYQGNNTYLALQTDIKTEFETEQEDESEDEEKGFAENEAQVSINSEAASGFFSWVETAMADNMVIDVISTIMDAEDEDDDLEAGENQQIIFFTFNATNPDLIVWDPKVGVNNDQIVQLALSNTSLGANSGLPLSVWGLLVIFAIPVFIRRRD